MIEDLKVMKKNLYITILCCIATLSVSAQQYSLSPATDPAIQSQKLMKSGANYEGTIYEPFSNTTPSEYLNGVSTTDVTNKTGGPRKDFYNPGDPGNQSNEYPIGEPWILAVFAALMAGVIALRKKRPASKS